MSLATRLSLHAAALCAAGVLACGPGMGEGGVPDCEVWLAEVDDCGGWLGLDEAWCEGFRIYINDGCDCTNVFDWYREHTTCADGSYGWAPGASAAGVPSCEC